MNNTEYGTLFIVATPIGNLADISMRAIETLGNVDLIAAEDTRHSKKLLQHYQINTHMVAFHEHNQDKQVAQLIQRLLKGDNIALISDAGTPLVSDPGHPLIQQAQQHGISVSPIPGACAAIVALVASGLPADHFSFVGFLSAKKGSRENQLQALKNHQETLIFYESPHRLLATLEAMQTIFTNDRRIVLAKELTKHNEAIISGSAEQIIEWLNEIKQRQLGEFVILVHGAEKKREELSEQITHILTILLAELSVKQAVKLTTKITGANKNEVYDIALSLRTT